MVAFSIRIRTKGGYTMVKHIVMWRFKESVNKEEQPALKQDMKEHLEGLQGQIPGLLKLEFKADLLSKSTHDMALVSEFESAKDLANYSSHPKHVAVADTYVRPFVYDRSCLDYEE